MARHIHIHVGTRDNGFTESDHPRDNDGRFKKGDRVKVKAEHLDEGEDPDHEYEVLEDQEEDDQRAVHVRSTKPSNLTFKPTHRWPTKTMSLHHRPSAAEHKAKAVKELEDRIANTHPDASAAFKKKLAKELKDLKASK